MIICIGDLVVDLIVKQKEINYGTDSVGNIRISAGGQANNVAAWVAKDGVETKLLGLVGRDYFGEFLVKEAKDKGIVMLLDRDEQHETGKILILVEEGTGERSMITHRGANLYLQKSHIYKHEEDIKNADALYLSGYSFYAKKPKEAIGLAKEMALKHGVEIAIDPSSIYYLKTMKDQFLNFLDGVTFLFPNYDEGKELTGKSDPKEIVLQLREIVPYPILSLGKEGALIYIDGEFQRVPAKEVIPVDTTGAGDAFAGAFLASYSRTKDLLGSVCHAVKVSSRVVGMQGARPRY